MKKLSLICLVFVMTVMSCGDKKKETTGSIDQIVLGKKLFTDKTCTTCHALDSKVIGPSIKEMIKIYDEKDGDLVQFLRGNADAIVDTDPGQVAIMQANLDGFVKDMSDEELQALVAYMRDAAK